jgi:diguanylate cyclase (GGDEF)-like protein/PAS domain S-box-containing protein
MFGKLMGASNKEEVINEIFEDFPLPVFFKNENNKILTNKIFDEFTGANRQKVLQQLLNFNTLNSSHFETKIENDIGKSIDAIVYISDTGNMENDEKLGIIVDISEKNRAKETMQRLKERYELATNGSDEGLWDWEIKNDKAYFSNRFKEILGIANQPVKDSIKTWLNRIHPDDKIRVIQELEDHINAKSSSFHCEHRIVTEETTKWVSIKGKVTQNKEGYPQRIVGFLTDISEIKFAQLALKNSEEQFKLFMKNLPAGAFIKDEKHNIIFSNQYLNDFFGVDTLVNKNIKTLLPEQDYNSIINTSDLVLKHGMHTTEEKLVNKNGDTKYFQAHRFLIKKDGKNLIAGIFADITDQKLTQNKLNILAHYDLLTNLPNRALFQDTLTRKISKAKRNKNKIALMFIDLDNFKMINDTLGHDYGDLLLIEVAKRLTGILREEDLVARLGGDEFTVILDDIKDTAYPSVVAQKIIDSLSQPIKLKDEIGYIGASVGIAIFPDDAQNKEDLIKNADMAMYSAKQAGKNVYRYFTEDMNADAKERLELSNDLRNAIQNNQLKLYYQPIIDTQTNTLYACEALVRWEHPKYGIIPPENFIKLAEEGGFMAQIGKWIIKRACAQLKTMEKLGLSIKVAINISSKQLTQNHLEHTLKTIIKESGVKAEHLELEVTESFLMENLKQVKIALGNLQKLGVKTAIDDFGTGYSSLAILKKLPISKLKIDKSFISDIPNDEDDMQIASTIIALAKGLNLQIVAEGVETKEQVDFLKKEGCHLMQGYYFSEAIAETDFNTYLHSRAK